MSPTTRGVTGAPFKNVMKFKREGENGNHEA